jgi:hypothetical protein
MTWMTTTTMLDRLEKWILGGGIVALILFVVLAFIGLWTVGEWIFG